MRFGTYFLLQAIPGRPADAIIADEVLPAFRPGAAPA